MIMNWMRKCKGSISIFLCLILLPMVTYSTVIIDASRMQTSKVNLSNAGDLTMNAALSEYETVLKDLYGLFAVSGHESPDKFQKSLEMFFRQTIENNVLMQKGDGTYVQDVSSYLAQSILSGKLLDNEDYDNLIKMKIDDFKCEPVSGSALANPATLKKQIIDYMKYRGPVSIVTTLFPKLEFLKDSSNQTEAVEAKIEYTEKLSGLQDPCEIIYAILEGGNYDGNYNTGSPKVVYNKLAGDIVNDPDVSLSDEYGYSFNKYLDYKGIDNIRDSVEDNLKNMVYMQILEKNIPSYSDWNSGKFTSTENDYDVNYDSWSDDIYNNLTTKDPGDIKGEVNTLYGYLTEVSGYYNGLDIGSIESWVNTLNNYGYVSGDHPSNDQDRMNSRFEHIRSVEYKEDILRKFYNYRHWICELRERIVDYNNEIVRRINALPSGSAERSDLYDNYYVDIHSKSTSAVTIRDGLDHDGKEGIVNSLYDALNEDHLKEPYREYAKRYFSAARSDIAYLQCYLDSLIPMLSDVETQCDNISSALAEAESAKVHWKESIESVSSSTIRENMNSDYESTTASFDSDKNEGDVDAFKQYVTKQKGRFETSKNALRDVKLYGEAILDHAEASDFQKDDYSSLNIRYPKSDMDQQNQIDDKVKNVFNTNYSKLITDSFSPGYEPIEGVQTYSDPDWKKEEFFFTIKSIAEPKDGKTDETGQKSWDQIKNDSKVSGGKPSESKDDKLKTEPTELTKDDDTNYFSAINNIIAYIDPSAAPTSSSAENKVEGLSDENIPKGKDDVKELKKKDNGKKSLSEGKGILNAIGNLGATVVNSVYLEEYFTELFTCQTDAIVASTADDGTKVTKYQGFNRELLDSSAPWYGKEVEYILWGNQNLDTCLLENEALIFTIRFALNAIYAFTATDIQTFALETATAIAGWTIVGVPIVQAIITVAIALAESAYDLHLLKNGEDVPIYKNASTFVCSPTGLLTTIVEKAADAAIDLGTKVVEKVASKAETAIDNFIDSVSDRADEELSSFVNEQADNVNAIVSQFLQEKSAAVRSMAENIFINPILDQINSVYSSCDDELTNINTVIDNKIDIAFTQIQQRIDALDDGIVKEIASEVYNKVDSSGLTMKETIKSTVKKYFADLKTDLESGTSSLQSIRDSISGNEGVIAKYFDLAQDTIKKFVTDNSKEIVDNLKNVKNKKVGDLKNTIHEEIDGMSSKITTGFKDATISAKDKINTGISNYAGKNEAEKTKINLKKGDNPLDETPDTGSESGGVTLNYKEYCKIFVLIHIITDEEIMLQRAAAIMDRNVNYKKYGSKSADGDKFSMSDANTMMSVKAKVKMNTIFPWNNVEISADDAENGFSPVFTPAHYGQNYVNINYNGVTGY